MLLSFLFLDAFFTPFLISPRGEMLKTAPSPLGEGWDEGINNEENVLSKVQMLARIVYGIDNNLIEFM